MDEEARQGSRRRYSAYAALALLGATLFGQTTVSAEDYPYTPSEVAEMMRDLNLLLAGGLGLDHGRHALKGPSGNNRIPVDG